MLTNDVLADAFDRIKQEVHQVVDGLDLKALTYRPGPKANSISWLVWHLTRIQDDHIASATGQEQVWIKDAWLEKFGLPFAAVATGWGQSSDEVARVQVAGDQLLDYYDAVHKVTQAYLNKLTEKDYAKVVDANWDPPVTLVVRLMSVISDDLQHVGQAAYIKGLLK